MRYLDTSIAIQNREIRILIGPNIKLRQNTIFFNKPFVITNSRIDSCRIYGSFLQHLIFDNSQFLFPIEIDSTAFDTLFFERCRFNFPLSFRNLEVQNFLFQSNEYPEDISFINCRFKNIIIERSTIPSKLKFTNCTYENLYFRRTHFFETFDLSGGTIPGKIDLDSCIFEKNLLLSSLNLSNTSSFSFINTKLPDTFKFSFNADIPLVDLSKAELKKNRKCKVLLYQTTLSKLQMNYAFFKMIFPENISKDETASMYEDLLRNFKDRNYTESYRLLDIEYKEFKSKNSGVTFLWWVPKYWSNYGYNQERVIYWTALFILLFTLFNSAFLNHLLLKVYKVDFIPIAEKYGFSRVWYSLIFTGIIFFTLPIKWEKINFKNKGGTIYLFSQFIIGLVCLWYIGKFIL